LLDHFEKKLSAPKALTIVHFFSIGEGKFVAMFKLTKGMG